MASQCSCRPYFTHRPSAKLQVAGPLHHAWRLHREGIEHGTYRQPVALVSSKSAHDQRNPNPPIKGSSSEKYIQPPRYPSYSYPLHSFSLPAPPPTIPRAPRHLTTSYLVPPLRTQSQPGVFSQGRQHTAVKNMHITERSTHFGEKKANALRNSITISSSQHRPAQVRPIHPHLIPSLIQKNSFRFRFPSPNHLNIPFRQSTQRPHLRRCRAMPLHPSLSLPK